MNLLKLNSIHKYFLLLTIFKYLSTQQQNDNIFMYRDYTYNTRGKSANSRCEYTAEIYYACKSLAVAIGRFLGPLGSNLEGGPRSHSIRGGGGVAPFPAWRQPLYFR